MSAVSPAQSDVHRSAPIVMGRTDYFSVLLRLIGMDLYKVRRRLLSRVMLLVGTVIIIGIFLVIGAWAWHLTTQPVTSFHVDSCAQYPYNPDCINHPATLADMQAEKTREVNGVKPFLDIPGVWKVEERFIISTLSVLGIILAGTLVGGEYSLGTVRLMYTRGPTRAQFLLANIVTLAIIVVPLITLWALLGMAVGSGMAHLAGIGVGLEFFTAPLFDHFVLFLLLGMLYWFAYMMMAVFFAVAGRSTVAGVVGPLVWLAIEPILNTIVVAFTSGVSGPFSDFVKHIPEYFLGTNLTSLIQFQLQALTIGGPAPYMNEHSLEVVAVYLIVFIGVTWLLTVRRDVTN